MTLEELGTRPLPPTTGPVGTTSAGAGQRVGPPVPPPAVRDRRKLHRLSFVVLVVGLVVTGALTVSSRLSYLHTEQHLSNLQTGLTASALGVAPVDLERRLGQAAAAAGEASDPVCHVPSGHRAVACASRTIRDRIARSRARRSGPGPGACRSPTDQQSHRSGGLGPVRAGGEVRVAGHDQGGGQGTAAVRISDVVRRTGWNLRGRRRRSLAGQSQDRHSPELT